jgi:ParB-like chromosome segregation protein Spo0J
MTTTINLPADKFDNTMTFVRPENPATRVALDKLAVLPGFNTRVKDADYNERVTGIAESIVANGFFDDKPFAVTMLPGDDTVYIYDGEHRFDAAKAALLDGAEFPDGLPVAWAKDGATVRDLTIHLAHGNAGERLNMVELAAVVRRMQGLGMEKGEIAEALGRTTRHIDNLFVLAEANQTVKRAVASGKIAGAEAVKLVRKHGSKDAATEITARIKKAEEQGKAKATPKTAISAPTGPKMKKVNLTMTFGTGDVMADLLKNMAKAIRAEVQIGEGDKLAEDGKIEVVIHVVDQQAEAAKIAAEKAKAEAAAKREAEKAEAAKAKAEAKAKREAEKAEAAKKKEAEAKAKRAAEAKLLKEAAKGKPASGAKTPAKDKPAKAPAKPKAASKASEAPAAAESPEKAPSTGDDGMGGL